MFKSLLANFTLQERAALQMRPSCKGWCSISEAHTHADTQLKIRTVDEGDRSSMSALDKLKLIQFLSSSLATVWQDLCYIVFVTFICMF